MAGIAPVARVVLKEKYDQQHFFDVNISKLPTLASSSVRVQSLMFTLSSNNLSYCAMGDILHWWKVYPVPAYLPAPFNDPQTYGIGPAWGFAQVVESTISGLKPGTKIWGMIPTSTMLTDLQLEQSKEISSHWFEVSKHREPVMPLYKRYLVADESDNGPYANSDKKYWMTAFLTAFEAGFLFNKVFTARPGEKPIAPFPDLGMSWSAEEADLSSTLIIVLGAGGKSCRSFVHQLATNRLDGKIPKGVVEVTSGSESRSPVNGLGLRFVHRVMGYDAIQSADTLKWIKGIDAKRVMIFDFGGRVNTKQLTIDLRQELPERKVDLVAVGGVPSVYSPADKAARMALAEEVGALRVNASGIRVAIMEQIGEQAFFDQLFEAFNQVVESELARHLGTEMEGQVLGIKLDVRHGVSELEKTWSQIPRGELPGDVGCVIVF